MFLDVLTVLVTVIATSGWGFLIPIKPGGPALTFGDRALLGIALIAAVGLLANFFVPLPSPVAIATVCVGVAALLWRARAVRESLGSRPVATALALVLLSVVFGLGSRLSSLHADMGLYHLQLIRWMETSPRVFGLGLVHDRFGFNSIWHALAVMLDVPGLDRRGVLLPNASLYVIVFGNFLEFAFRSLRSELRSPAANVFAGCVMALFIGGAELIPFSYLSIGPSYDAPTWLLGLHGFWRFLRFAEAPAASAPAEQLGNRLMTGVSAALAVMVKVSSVPLLLLLPAVLVGRREEGAAERGALLRTPVTALLAVLGVLWLATGLSSSGCLVFPAAASCVTALPWTLPVHDVQLAADMITAYARNPVNDFMSALHGWDWVATWPHTMLAARPFLPRVYAILAVLAAVLVTCRIVDLFTPAAARDSGRSRALHGWFAYALFTALVGSAFWFVKAPDPRFGLGFLFATPSLLLAWIAAGSPRRVGVARFLAGGLGLGVLTAALSLWVLCSHWTRIQQATAQWAIPQVQLTQRMLGPDTAVSVPVGTTECWDAPLPCTPVLNAPVREGRYGPWHYFVPDAR